jgi:hypothetical protein
MVMSKIHETIQYWLESQNLDYTIQAENFVIDGDGPKPFKYVPYFILIGKRFRSKVIVVEPITSFAPQGGLKRVQTFRNQFRDKYHVVVIAKKRMIDRIPRNAYDQLIEFEKLDTSRVKFR